MDRSSGILMPISSLPSPYGIGTFGKAAYRFADFLHEAGQKYWQLLPLGPTSYGDSPYQAFSTFAGNPYFIDLDTLIADDLLTQKEVDACAWGTEPRYVDYGKIYESRFALLEKAKPVMEYRPGWLCDISGARTWEELPQAAREYVEYVEQAIGCHIGYVSVGAERDSLIVR